MKDPIPGLKGRFFVEQNDSDENFVEPNAGKYVGKRGKKKVQINDSLDKDKGKVGEGSSHKDLGKRSARGSSNKGKGKLGSLVTYRWIAEHYDREIIDNPWVSYNYMQNSIRSKFMINVSLGQCKRAKQAALFDHEGGLIDHYSKIWQYRQAVLDSNPGSTCHIDLEENDDGLTYFNRFYVCFFGLKAGWLEGCRKVIGLDGCFLTHTCKGQLLNAIDEGNNLIKSYSYLIYEHIPNIGVDYIIFAMKWVVYASGFQEVEVRRQDEAFGVNIHLKKCACKMWELIGLPCVHVVVGYIHLKKDPELGVTEWFSKNKWFESYQYSIRPVPGTKLWKKSDLPKPLPPGERKLPGRPRKRRIRHPSKYDHEISRVGRVMHCHMCWQSGHNKSKYTNAPKPKPDNFYEIPTDEERKHGFNNKSNQVNEASGSKSNLTPEEHAEIMDKEAFEDLVRKDAENKAKEDEMWRHTYEKEKYWEEYASEFKDWEFREEQENRIGIMLSVDDEHIIGNTEVVNPAEQLHVIACASSAPVDEQPETS
nr:zinc finger, PMZ-type [Tanacetum cinerariifolium]